MEPDTRLSELDKLIAGEQRLEALRSHGEAWASGIRDGIDPAILADTALYTAFHELIRCSGEAAALAIAARLHDRIISGEFEPERVHH